MIRKYQLNIRNLWYVLLICVLGLLSITWFRDGFLIDQGDQLLPLLPVNEFVQSLYTWDSFRGTGFVTPPGLANFFYFLIMALLAILRISLNLSEKILYYVIFTGSGLTVYYLMGVLFPKLKNIVRLFSALSYMFCFYPILVFWIGLPPLGLFYMFLPLILALFIKYIHNPRIFNQYLVFSLFTISTITFPTYILVIFIVFIIYLIYIIFYDGLSLVLFKKIILFFLGYTLLNLWWLIPFVFNSYTFQDVGRIQDSLQILKYLSSDTSIINLFRLMGYPTFYSSPYSPSQFLWSSWYLKSNLMLLGFIQPIMIAFFIFNRKKDKVLLFFLLLFAVFIVMTKGSHSPFKTMEFVFNKIIILGLFRNPYEKFGGVLSLCFAVLSGLGFDLILDRLDLLRKKIIKKIIVFVLFFLCFGIYMWPYWTGEIIYAGSENKASARIIIPSSYQQAAEWIKRMKSDFRILSLPHQNGAAFNWEYGYVGSADPTMQLIQKPFLSPFDPNDKIMSSFLKDIFNNFSEVNNASNQNLLIGIANIKYVLVHNDANMKINTVNPNLSIDQIKVMLNSNQMLYLENYFGKLDFYKIDDRFYLPHIYIPKKYYDIQLFKDNELEIYTSDARKALYYDINQFTDLDNAFSEEVNEIPNIEFVKINPTKYLIKVNNAKKAFMLVFSETYNDQWKLYVNGPSKNNVGEKRFGEVTGSYFDGEIKERAQNNIFLDKYTFETWGMKPLPEDQHILINGYANSWFITPADGNGRDNYEMILEYKPQQYLYIGGGISLITLFGGVVVLLFSLIKPKSYQFCRNLGEDNND